MQDNYRDGSRYPDRGGKAGRDRRGERPEAGRRAGRDRDRERPVTGSYAGRSRGGDQAETGGYVRRSRGGEQAETGGYAGRSRGGEQAETGGYAGPDSGRDRREPDENRIEGRNAVIEAYRAGRTIEKLFLLEGPAEGAMQTVLRLAKEHRTPVRFLNRQRLDQLSLTGRHQGVIAQAAAFSYSGIDDLFAKAAEKGEDPFFILLDQIEDPHNLGAIIRTANLAGAHGVIIPKDRAVGLTATAVKASAGAIHHTPVVKVTNLGRTMDELKKRGLWFVCADMDGTPMTELAMTGPIGLVIGAEGSGVSRLVREKCDLTASIPMKGEIDSLNASVAAGVLMYEIVRQREMKEI